MIKTLNKSLSFDGHFLNKREIDPVQIFTLLPPQKAVLFMSSVVVWRPFKSKNDHVMIGVCQNE
jgi:hypothetical protein